MLETKGFRAGDEHFSAGDERFDSACSNFGHIHIASYQLHPNTHQVRMIDTHMYSRPKTGGITLSCSPPNIRYIHKLDISSSA